MWLFHNITADASWEDLCTISSYLIEWRLLPSLDPFPAGQLQTCPFLACFDCIGSHVMCGCLTADIGCVCLLNVFEHPWHVFYPCHGRYSIGVLPENPRTSNQTGTFWCCVLAFIFYNQESCFVRRLCREEEAKVQEGKTRDHCKSKPQNDNRCSNWKVRAPKLCCCVSNFLGAAFLRPRKLLLNFIYWSVEIHQGKYAWSFADYSFLFLSLGMTFQQCPCTFHDILWWWSLLVYVISFLLLMLK
jgi:hypothetical protein